MKIKTNNNLSFAARNEIVSHRLLPFFRVKPEKYHNHIVIVVLLFLTLISYTACQDTNQSRQTVERPKYERTVKKLVETATALCKIDFLQNEGIATLNANGPGITSKQKEIDNLSTSYADVYLQTLKKIKKFPRKEIEKELRRFCDFQKNKPSTAVILPVIMRHIDEIYLGMPITAKDISQDFQALRYTRSLQNAAKYKH